MLMNWNLDSWGIATWFPLWVVWLRNLKSWSKYLSVKAWMHVVIFFYSGLYSIRLFVQGVPEEILMDNLFPCYENNNLFLTTNRNIWSLLLEKGFFIFMKTCQVLWKIWSPWWIMALKRNSTFDRITC